jgi:hypothetical protein
LPLPFLKKINEEELLKAKEAKNYRKDSSQEHKELVVN